MIANNSNCFISLVWLVSVVEGDSIINATLLKGLGHGKTISAGTYMCHQIMFINIIMQNVMITTLLYLVTQLVGVSTYQNTNPVTFSVLI